MTDTWGTLKILLTIIGPLLFSKVLGFYRAPRSPHSLQVRPIPLPVIYSLIILFGTVLFFLVQTLPYFSPEEIFSLTNSRIQSPNDLLFSRLSAIRPAGLTESDKILKSRFLSLDMRLLYLQHGISTIISCTFCNSDDPKSYFYFSIPTLLFPHLLNIFVLGVTTSSIFTGRDGNIWRTQVNMAAIILCALDLYLVFSYAYRSNSKAKILGDVDFFFWKARIYRLCALAILDGVFGLVLYLSSTHRALSRTVVITEQLEALNYVLDDARSKILAAGIVQNTIVRDRDLSDKSQRYWNNEIQTNREIFEEREVVENIKEALEKRIDICAIEKDAEDYAQMIIAPFYDRTREGVMG